MKFNLRPIFLFILVGIAGYGVWNTYLYFFDTSAPVFKLVGIEDNGYYAGAVTCLISGSDSYKVGTISVFLDNCALVDKHTINRGSFEYSFTFNTLSLQQGRHRLLIEIIDGAYKKNKAIKEYIFYTDNVPLQVSFVENENSFKVYQGRTLHVQFQANKPVKNAQVHLFSERYICFPESKKSLLYECFIPVSCEEVPNEYSFIVHVEDFVGNEKKLEHVFQVLFFPFKKQTISIKPEQIEEEKASRLHHELLEKKLLELVALSPCEKLWQGTFIPPIDILRVTTPYGTIRTTQERGRYMHKAVDVINAPKSVVWAPQDGVVVLQDCYSYSGNTVVIDHGWGIFSLFYHLDSFADLKVGQLIRRGNPIGTIGKTGYATGYHLHWEMRINNIPVDPLQWTKSTF